ncbi:MAG: xanthine dehydrogenase family protein subunit M, partial [Halobacteriaceae archaeon]
RDPYPSTKTGMAFIEQKPAAQTWPTISAAAIVQIDDPTTDSPTIEEARIALGNVDDIPLRVEEAESVIEGTALSEEALQEAGEEIRELIVEAEMPE